MKSIETIADLCLDDELGFQYRLAVMKYIEYEDETYEYQLYPNYSVIDMLKPPRYQGIPGYDITSRKEVYIRKNMTPVLISERSPSKNRVDLQELLASCHMTYLNRLLWLTRTDLRYFGDYFYFREHMDTETVYINDIKSLGNRSAHILHELLSNICAAKTIHYKNHIIDDSNRLMFYEFLYPIYKAEKKYIEDKRNEGVEKAKSQGKYKGRKRKDINNAKMLELCHDYSKHLITVEEITHILKISEATFYRRYREYKKEREV